MRHLEVYNTRDRITLTVQLTNTLTIAVGGGVGGVDSEITTLKLRFGDCRVAEEWYFTVVADGRTFSTGVDAHLCVPV